MSNRFVVERLGAQGDGIVQAPSGPVFIAFALPGESVTATMLTRDRAELVGVLAASPQRVAPSCRHFTECGGCALQHFAADAYHEWKREKVVQSLKSKGIAAPVAPVAACAPGSRRRVVLSARRTGAGMLLGYNRALSHEIIDIAECPVAEPAIIEALPRLRELAGLVCATGEPFHLAVTATNSGLDVAFSGSGRLSQAARMSAGDFVIANGMARVSVDGEIIMEPRKPVVMFGAVAVTPPPGAFLQAVATVEQAMADLVCGYFGKAGMIADLFAGTGAFALRLARQARVHAVEGDMAALGALDHGFRFASGLRRVTSERRDLFRRPLTAKELNAYDAIVFDPPRAGAEDQARQIARSDVPLVAAVSCNPATLARDLRILLDGGYSLEGVTPFDQFLWSGHVEAVALLRRSRKKR